MDTATPQDEVVPRASLTHREVFHVETDLGMWNRAMDHLSGALTRHAGNRFRNDPADAKQILRDIEREPVRVRDRLDPPLRETFDGVFPRSAKH